MSIRSSVVNEIQSEIRVKLSIHNVYTSFPKTYKINNEEISKQLNDRIIAGEINRCDFI